MDKKVNEHSAGHRTEAKLTSEWGCQGQHSLRVHLPDFAPFPPVTSILVLQALINQAS